MPTAVASKVERSARGSQEEQRGKDHFPGRCYSEVQLWPLKPLPTRSTKL